MTTPSRLADRVTALAGSADLSGFTPFLSPLMFFLNENLWPTMTLMVPLAAILLMAFVVVGWRRGRVQFDGNSVIRNPKAVPVSTRVRRVGLATLRQEFPTFAWR